MASIIACISAWRALSRAMMAAREACTVWWVIIAALNGILSLVRYAMKRWP